MADEFAEFLNNPKTVGAARRHARTHLRRRLFKRNSGYQRAKEKQGGMENPRHGRMRGLRRVFDVGRNRQAPASWGLEIGQWLGTDSKPAESMRFRDAPSGPTLCVSSKPRAVDASIPVSSIPSSDGWHGLAYLPGRGLLGGDSPQPLRPRRPGGEAWLVGAVAGGVNFQLRH